MKYHLNCSHPYQNTDFESVQGTTTLNLKQRVVVSRIYILFLGQQNNSYILSYTPKSNKEVPDNTISCFLFFFFWGGGSGEGVLNVIYS